MAPKVKFRNIIILVATAALLIISFQVSWLRSSYKISRDKLMIDINRVLDRAFLDHKNFVADSVRTILKGIVTDSNDYTFQIFNGKQPMVGYRTTHGGGSYVTFPMSANALRSVQSAPFTFLRNKIATANYEKLNPIVSVVAFRIPFPKGSVKEQLARKLRDIFDLHKDTAKLSQFIRTGLTANGIKGDAIMAYYNDIADLHKQPEKPGQYKAHNTSAKIVEVVSGGTHPNVAKKLESLSLYTTQLNESRNELYFSHSFLDDPDDVLMNKVPAIVVRVPLSSSAIISEMLMSIISSILLLSFVGASIWYMLRTILRQKKIGEIKDDFINNISHELKTPIATALAAVQGMQHFEVLKDQEKTKIYLKTAELEMKRLDAMITNILNSAVLEGNGVDLNPTNFSIRELLEGLIAQQQLRTEKQIVIKCTFNGNETISADQAQLVSVFNNLLDNAIKYADESVKIIITVSASNNAVTISVSDNGIGIPIGYHQKIFDKFFRVPKPDDHSVKGHGLGLYYVKNIIEAHGGSIKLTGPDKQGSTFIVHLPQ